MKIVEKAPLVKIGMYHNGRKSVLAKLISSEPDDLAFTDGGRNRRRK